MIHTIELLDRLAGLLAAGEPCAWVSVAATRGSTPREPGARMVVSARAAFGSIGGGHLELLAVEHARRLLAGAAGERVVRYPLGASAGQCCGGVVFAAFDVLDAARTEWLESARQLERAGMPWLRLAPLAPGAGAVHAVPAAEAPQAPFRAVVDRLLAGPGDGATLLAEALPQPWLVELVRPPALHLALFGAGHVGRALVEVLGRLPLRVSWIDSRADEFPPVLPANAQVCLSDEPVDEIAAQPPGSAVLVMTHSHALDFELVRGWLQRGDFAFLGLIGSRAKRAAFLARLRARGVDEADLARLTCPVGVPGVAGKEPAVIAVAVAAQLMSLREARAGALQLSTPATPRRA